MSKYCVIFSAVAFLPSNVSRTYKPVLCQQPQQWPGTASRLSLLNHFFFHPRLWPVTYWSDLCIGHINQRVLPFPGQPGPARCQQLRWPVDVSESSVDGETRSRGRSFRAVTSLQWWLAASQGDSRKRSCYRKWGDRNFKVIDKRKLWQNEERRVLITKIW